MLSFVPEMAGCLRNLPIVAFPTLLFTCLIGRAISFVLAYLCGSSSGRGRPPMWFMGSTRLAFVATMHQFGESSLNGPLNWKLMLETFLLRRMKRICCVSQ